MFICGVFMALPLVMIINNALKPLDEIFQYPPRIFVKNPTMENFTDLFVLMNDSWVPFSRYILNTLIITVSGTVGHVIVASFAAYPLAKHNFPGKKIIFGLVLAEMQCSSLQSNIVSNVNFVESVFRGIFNCIITGGIL